MEATWSFQCLSLAALVGWTLAGSAWADLPTHTDRSWQTDFAGMESRKYRLRFNSGAEGRIEPIGDKGKTTSERSHPKVVFVIEESLPGGKTVTKKIDCDTLETKDKPFLKTGKATFRAKVAGGASLEGAMAIEGGDFVFGAKLLDKGEIKNPARVGILIQFPALYQHAKNADKDGRTFEKRLEDDRYAFVWTDGKRMKMDGTDKVDEDGKKQTGPGISQFAMEASEYQGRSFEIKSSGHASMSLRPGKSTERMSDGFSLCWFPDPAKDPKAEARVTFRVR